MPEYTEKELAVFKYLFELQTSGIANMLGAIPYLRNKFSELKYEECNDLLLTWINDYLKIKNEFVLQGELQG